jgi:hypothetical protein
MAGSREFLKSAAERLNSIAQRCQDANVREELLKLASELIAEAMRSPDSDADFGSA